MLYKNSKQESRMRVRKVGADPSFLLFLQTFPSSSILTSAVGYSLLKPIASRIFLLYPY